MKKDRLAGKLLFFFCTIKYVISSEKKEDLLGG